MSEFDLRELVVFSLEPWDDVWRRNQFFVDILLQRNPALRVLFVEPPTDPVHALRMRTLPAPPRLKSLSHGGRLRAFRPVKPLPRRAGRLSDRALLGQALLAMRIMRLSRPILWLNDSTYAPLLERTGFPSLYDMTDDWLLAPFSEREIKRLRRLEDVLFERVDEIVVCSPALMASRGSRRPLTLVPNGVDLEHFRRPQTRPRDLPVSPVAVYVGSLHESRLDVDLVIELATSIQGLSVVLVGPDSLQPESRGRLLASPNISLLGPRPYDVVPGYLQHADVIVVPHVVSPFTESLDPIKAYECLASARPTVATPVAGFRDLADRITIAPREKFGSAVADALQKPATESSIGAIPTWHSRAESFERVLVRAGRAAPSLSRPGP